MLDAYKTETGTVLVRDPKQEQAHTGRIALYSQVSSIGQKEDLDRQLVRLKEYAAARGYQVSKEVTEIASGLNNMRPKLEKLLADTSIGTIVVESRDRLIRFGSHSIETLLEAQGRHVEMIFQSDTGDELVDDLVSVITSMAARISGRRTSKRRAQQIKQCVEQVMKKEEEERTMRGYRVELDLSNAHVTACRKHAGASRWAYNYGLRRKQEAYKAGQKTPSAIDLHREINALKPQTPWMYEVSKCAFQEGLRDLDTAFKHFFRRYQLKKEGKWKGKCGTRATKVARRP